MDDIENTASYAKRTAAGNFDLHDVAMSFSADFLDEDTCRRWILGIIYHEKDFSCPQCSAPLTGKGLLRFRAAQRVRCHACGKFFTALTGTFLQGCHLTFRQIILLAVFLYFGIRHEAIANKVGISEETVRLWQKKFQAIKQIRDIENENGSTEI